MSDKKVVVMHRDMDGWAAAAIVPDVDTYYGVGYNFDKQMELLNICGGRDVVIVDFSFPENTMKNLKDVAKSLTWIDHHESSKGLLEMGLPGIHDVTKAGCWLAWEYYHPGEEMPKAVFHVGDRDIWTFTDPDTKAFCFGASNLPGIDDPGSPTWQSLVAGEFYAEVLEGGRFVETAINTDNIWRKRTGVYRDKDLFLVNATAHISELADMLLNEYGMDNLIIVWRVNKHGIDLSFRGKGAREMAESLGGGGHERASGAKLPLKEGMALVTELMGQMYPA